MESGIGNFVKMLVSTDEESKKEQVKGEKAHIIATSLLML